MIGTPLPNARPMNTGDWRSQLTPDIRGTIINKILITLNKHLPNSGPEGINELRRIAARFEEKIFSCAVNQNDYLRKISMTMLTMETKSQFEAGSSSSIPAANDGTSMDSVLYGIRNLFLNDHHMDNDNSKPSLSEGELAVNTGDWRTQLPLDLRQKNVNKIMETLKKHVPNSGQEGNNELMRIAVSFEGLIFNSAINQVDYFRKISFKMLTVEEGD